MKFYDQRFHYENECQRIDAPIEDVGEWLKYQARDMVNEKYGDGWSVYKTRLDKQEDGSHVYVVMLKCD